MSSSCRPENPRVKRRSAAFRGILAVIPAQIRAPLRHLTAQVRQRHRARPEPDAGRTATAQRYGVIIPTASRVAIVRISGAWTATTTAGPANDEMR